MRMSPDAKLALRILLAGIFFLQIDTSGSTGTYCCYNKCRFVYHFKAIGGPYYHVVNGIAVSNIQVSCPNIYPTNHSYQVAGGIVSYTTNSNGVEACAVPPNCNYGGIPAGPGGVPPGGSRRPVGDMRQFVDEHWRRYRSESRLLRRRLPSGMPVSVRIPLPLISLASDVAGARPPRILISTRRAVSAPCVSSVSA